MTNPLFHKRADQLELTERFLIDNGWADVPAEQPTWTKDGVGTVTWDFTGWTFFDETGTEKDFGSTLGDLKKTLGYAPHPEEGFMRGKQFRPKEVEWKETDKGEKVPQFVNEDDQKFMKELRISRDLRRKVIAAHMNGYAEHANKWLREKGNTYLGCDKYAVANGLNYTTFQQAIHTMSRYASFKKKLAEAPPLFARKPEDFTFEITQGHPRFGEYGCTVKYFYKGQLVHTSYPSESYEYMKSGEAEKRFNRWVAGAISGENLAAEEEVHDVDSIPVTAADPKWVGLEPPRKEPKPMGWKHTEPNAPAMPVQWTKQQPRQKIKMEPPIMDTPEFSAAKENLLALKDKSHIGEEFEVKFPEAIVETQPDLADYFLTQLKNWAKRNGVFSLFNMGWNDRKRRDTLVVRREKAQYEGDSVIDPNAQLRRKREHLTSLIQIPAEWVYRVNQPMMASKQAGDVDRGFAVPLESASHVAFHLFKAGLPDFNVETDDDARVTYFAFDSPADLEVAHEIVYQAFKRQIDAGKGLWANWREEEAHSERSDSPARKDVFSPVKENLASAEERNDLDACIYCKGQEPKNQKQRKRLKDTPRNRARELSLYRALTPPVKQSALFKKATTQFELEIGAVFPKHNWTWENATYNHHAPGKSIWKPWKSFTHGSMYAGVSDLEVRTDYNSWELWYKGDMIDSGYDGPSLDEALTNAKRFETSVEEGTKNLPKFDFKKKNPKRRTPVKDLGDSVPEFSEADKIQLHGLGVKGSVHKKNAGTWGERSYDNDTVHDILDQHRLKPNDPGGSKSQGFDEAIPHDELTGLYNTLDKLYEGVGGDDEAHFLGVVVFLLEHGTKVPPAYRSAAAGIARRMLRDPNYLRSWKNPQQRERVLKSELAMLGGMAMHAAVETEGSVFDEIANPVCLCNHEFYDHQRGCDHCDCPGFDPAPIEKQVEYVCEHRSFGRVGKLTNPMTFERHDGEMKLKVWFKEGRVEKAQFSDQGGAATTKPGWDGFFSFTQTFGD